MTPTTLSKAQQLVLDRMGDGYRLVQYHASGPRLIKENEHDIATTRRTISILIEKGLLTMQTYQRWGCREWVRRQQDRAPAAPSAQGRAYIAELQAQATAQEADVTTDKGGDGLVRVGVNFMLDDDACGSQAAWWAATDLCEALTRALEDDFSLVGSGTFQGCRDYQYLSRRRTTVAAAEAQVRAALAELGAPQAELLSWVRDD